MTDLGTTVMLLFQCSLLPLWETPQLTGCNHTLQSSFTNQSMFNYILASQGECWVHFRGYFQLLASGPLLRRQMVYPPTGLHKVQPTSFRRDKSGSQSQIASPIEILLQYPGGFFPTLFVAS